MKPGVPPARMTLTVSSAELPCTLLRAVELTAGLIRPAPKNEPPADQHLRQLYEMDRRLHEMCRRQHLGTLVDLILTGQLRANHRAFMKPYVDGPIEPGALVLDSVSFQVFCDKHGFDLAVAPEPEIGLKADPVLSDSKVEAEQRPQGVSKGVIAFRFADVHFSQERWGPNLEDPPIWLEAHKLTSGSKGRAGTQSTWDPIGVAKALVSRQRESAKQRAFVSKLNKAFASDDLSAYQNEWREFVDSMTGTA